MIPLDPSCKFRFLRLTDQTDSGIPHEIAAHSFRSKLDSKPGTTLMLSQGFGAPVIDKSVARKKTYTFPMSVHQGRYDVQVDGNPVFRDFSGSDIELLKEPFFAGLGGFYDQNEAVVRFRKLEIRIPPQPGRPTLLEPSKGVPAAPFYKSRISRRIHL